LIDFPSIVAFCESLRIFLRATSTLLSIYPQAREPHCTPLLPLPSRVLDEPPEQSPVHDEGKE